jgi:hypothetical protein
MFFRREKLSVPSFSERLDQLKSLGFTATAASGGSARISRGRYAAVIEDRGLEESVRVIQAGMVLDGDIGSLVNGGNQMLWQAPAGKVAPALATHLKELHAFEEDLKEGLGLVSLYNQSLGTTSDRHMYDRIANRDAGVPARAWEK